MQFTPTFNSWFIHFWLFLFISFGNNWEQSHFFSFIQEMRSEKFVSTISALHIPLHWSQPVLFFSSQSETEIGLSVNCYHHHLGYKEGNFFAGSLSVKNNWSEALFVIAPKYWLFNQNVFEKSENIFFALWTVILQTLTYMRVHLTCFTNDNFY